MEVERYELLNRFANQVESLELLSKRIPKKIPIADIDTVRSAIVLLMRIMDETE